MICDVVKPDGEPYEGDPRHVLRRALERMRQMGFDTFNVGPELEYFLFKDSTGTETLDEGGYFAMTALDAATDLRYETIKALEAVGIPIEYHHHEVAPSQHEIDMRYAPALEMADSTRHLPADREGDRRQARRLRDVHAEAAVRRERLGHAHAHVALQGRPQPVLRRRTRPTTSRPPARQFIAGLLHHARELSAVFAQWVNSYKRLVPGFEAPVYVAWSQRNRSALVRIPLYKPGSEQATRAEIRCPDPACNPYLTFAALLHAGLEGIARGYELPAPMETNLYHLTAEERQRARDRLAPETLGEAIDEFASSELMRRAFGDHIFDNYVRAEARRSGTTTACSSPSGSSTGTSACSRGGSVSRVRGPDSSCANCSDRSRPLRIRTCGFAVAS